MLVAILYSLPKALGNGIMKTTEWKDHLNIFLSLYFLSLFIEGHTSEQIEYKGEKQSTGEHSH